MAAWIVKALMAKMLISWLIKGKEQYLGCHGWLLSCRGSVVCFEALIMAVQTYNYELSEVRKLLEMNRQRGTRLLEGTYQSLFRLTPMTGAAGNEWASFQKTRYSSFIKKKKNTFFVTISAHIREERVQKATHCQDCNFDLFPIIEGIKLNRSLVFQ